METLQIYNSSISGSFRNHITTHFKNEVFFILDLASGNFDFITQSFKDTIIGYPIEHFYRDGILFFNSLIHKEDFQRITSNVLLLTYKINGTVKIKENFKINNANNELISVSAIAIVTTAYKSQRKLVGILIDESTTREKEVKEKEIYEHIEQLYSDYCQLMMPEKNEKEKSVLEILSRREVEVLRLIADGFSSKMLADKLCISQHTADSHRKNIMSKLRVKNTAEMVRLASRYL
ncbi:MAG TPA: helix-turn-helix transcriptional regulator [Cytophagaceae bacterium]